MNNDPYYQDLVAAGVPPATAAIMFTQNQQFVQMNHQFAQQQQTILALTNEIKDLAANKVGTTPTNTEGLFNAFAETVRAWNATNRPPNANEVRHWKRARDWYKITSSIKESCEKANAGEDPDEDATKFASFAKYLGSSKSAWSKSATKSTDNVQCRKCGRTNHQEKDCRARTDFRGIKLED